MQTVVAMPKFAANLSFLFTDAPFQERFQRAAAAGFAGVEYLFPYDWPAHDVAECVRWCLMLPDHVNIDEMLVKCVDQAAPHKLHRRV